MSLGELPYNDDLLLARASQRRPTESAYSNALQFTTMAQPAPPTTGGGVPGGVPKGPGGRTPDPTGGRLALPD